MGEHFVKTIIFADNTLPLAIPALCEVLNNACQKIEFSPGKARLRLTSNLVSFPAYYKEIPNEVLTESKSFDFAFMCTNVGYDNNYFFEYRGTEALLSFHGWNLLTDLPVSNGLAFFIASIICDECGIGETHGENTGCVNDFWGDKTGVNAGMRAGFVCASCTDKYTGDDRILHDLRSILDLVSTASRSSKDILEFSPPGMPKGDNVFDAFLCHSSTEKPAVRKINTELSAGGVKTWLDEEQLGPGVPWQPELEKQIESVRAVCVFVGESGLGPWHDVEIRAFLAEFVKRACLVVPVILPNAKGVPDLPIFLRQMTWVDLRKDYARNIARLIKALRRN